jgi:hypothetical protein
VPKPRAKMTTREKSTGEDAYLWAIMNSQVLKRRSAVRFVLGSEEGGVWSDNSSDPALIPRRQGGLLIG